jgi:hypothetical protein
MSANGTSRPLTLRSSTSGWLVIHNFRMACRQGVSAFSDAMTGCGKVQSPCHSALSAFIGSMREALRAGMYPARRATSRSVSAIPK